MTILIVDDDPHLGKLVGMRLDAEGYRTLSVRTAKQAFELLGLENPAASENGVDLVMLDIFLPDMSGIEACRHIKRTPHTADIPVIMITGSTEEEHLRQAFEAGATDYIEKPFKGVELLARIHAALRLKAEIDQRKHQAEELGRLAEQLRKANEQLRRLSFRDGLTGLYNRRYFDDFLLREFKRALRNRTSLALIMIDIDFFKSYNDRFGHQQGDECLRRIAATFTLVVHRSHDLVARYGGEEFAVVLPETDVQGAAAVAENLRQQVERLALSHPDSPFGVVTISEGVAAVVPGPDDQAEKLLEAADTALYCSKRGGRNRVSCAV